MKICPVCSAVAFDDALVCYGCLHQFTDGNKTSIQEDECQTINCSHAKVSTQECVDEIKQELLINDAMQDQLQATEIVTTEKIGKHAALDSITEHASRIVSEAPQFNIRMIPIFDSAGSLTWNCAVEMQ